MRKTSGLPSDNSSAISKAVKLGGGGYMTGGAISNDGLTKIGNVDVYNSYVWSDIDTENRPLFTSTSLANPGTPPAGTVPAIDAAGGYGGTVAPSDKTRIYCGLYGRFYVSSDRGLTLTYCNLAPKLLLTNSNAARYWNDKIAVHPTNADVAMFGTCGDGVYYTSNAGGTMTAVSVTGGLPAAALLDGTAAPYLVAFDPTNGNKVYFFAQGTGLYRSTTGVSGAFTAVSGSPTWCSHLYLDPLGTVWVCNPNGTFAQNLSSWNGTSWTTAAAFVSDVNPLLSVAVNPNNTNHLVAVTAGMGGVISVDRGASWIANDRWLGNRGMSLDSTADVPWLNGGNCFFGKIMFNPGVSGELWGWHGLGVAKSTPPTTYVAWTWYSQTKGVENLATSNGISLPGPPAPIFGCWDKPIWRRTNVDAYGGIYTTTDPNAGINHAWQFDYAVDDPNYVGLAAGFFNDTTGYSTDAGATWTPYFRSYQAVTGYTIANPAVFTVPSHGFLEGRPVTFTTPGNYLPIGLDGSVYRVKVVNANTFQVALTVGGASVAISGAGDGAVSVARWLPSGQAGGNGGAIAINTKAQQILIPGNNQRAIATHNQWGGAGNLEPVQGTDWDYLPLGPNVSGNGNWINANYIRRNLVTADKTRPGVFAIIMNGNNQGTGNEGLWVTTTGPLGTWTQKQSGRLDSQGDLTDFWDCTLTYIPGKSGELLYSSPTAVSWPNNRLIYYTNDGASGPTALGGFAGVDYFALGKALTGQSYPAVYVVGSRGGVHGLWASFDFFATAPVFLTAYINKSINNLGAMFADKNIFGRVYFGFAGNGWAYADYADIAHAT